MISTHFLRQASIKKRVLLATSPLGSHIRKRTPPSKREEIFQFEMFDLSRQECTSRSRNATSFRNIRHSFKNLFPFRGPMIFNPRMSTIFTTVRNARNGWLLICQPSSRRCRTRYLEHLPFLISARAFLVCSAYAKKHLPKHNNDPDRRNVKIPQSIWQCCQYARFVLNAQVLN